MPTSTGKTIDILLIEDSLSDIRLTQKVFEHARVPNRLSVIQDGESALQYLMPASGQPCSPLPDLILLDLILPRLSGHQVLHAIKGSEQLRHIPVIILTTSANEDDVRKAYQAHANAYIRKPVQFEAFIDVMRRIDGFWLTAAQLVRKNALQDTL